MDVALGNDCGRLLLDRVAPQRGSRDLRYRVRVRARVRLGLGLGSGSGSGSGSGVRVRVVLEKGLVIYRVRVRVRVDPIHNISGLYSTQHKRDHHKHDLRQLDRSEHEERAGDAPAPDQPRD